MTIDLSEEQRIKILNADDLYKIMSHILLRENKIDRDNRTADAGTLMGSRTGK